MLKSTRAVTDAANEPYTLQANESVEVLASIGKIDCINVARAGEPERLRYFGRGKGCSGQAHATFELAEADVRAWHAGQPVTYEQHAVVPLARIFPHGIPKPSSAWQKHLKRNWHLLLARLTLGLKRGRRFS